VETSRATGKTIYYQISNLGLERAMDNELTVEYNRYRYTSFKEKKEKATAFLDISNAFDNVGHEGLVYKDARWTKVYLRNYKKN